MTSPVRFILANIDPIVWAMLDEVDSDVQQSTVRITRRLLELPCLLAVCDTRPG